MPGLRVAHPATAGSQALVLFALAMGIGVWLPTRLTAQEGLGVAVEFAEADVNLNATYARVMNALPPSSREPLRRAQRAWIIFVDKYVAALPGSREQRWRFKLGETVARRELLEALLNPKRQAEVSQQVSQLREADRDLNQQYEKSLALLGEGAEAAREAQRAWIIYRDEHARMSKGSETEARIALTTQRVAQLRTYSASQLEPADDEEANASPISPEEGPVVPGRKVPDPFERAR